jgi:fumarate reductase flavoprotein subunit
MDLETKEMPEDLNKDVVIIGAGGAGLAAALTAVECGCKNVIVIEKAGSPGGYSAMAHDIFGVESPVQKQAGSDARRDQFFRIAMDWSHWSKVNPRILRAFIDKSGGTIKWLQAKGIHFELGQYYLDQSPRVQHVIEGEGAHLIKVLTQECERSGVQILTHTTGKKIIRNDMKNVTGVIARTNEQDVVINAKSVIITTGGYGSNKELIQKYCSYYNTNLLGSGPRNNTGDGIMMATEIGAATAGLGHLMFHGPSVPISSSNRVKIGEAEYGLGMLVREPVALWINKRGKRFIDEGHNLSSFASGNAIAQQPDGIMYSIFDTRTRTIMEEDGLIWPGAYGGNNRNNPRFARPLAGAPLPGLGKELLALAERSSSLKIADSLDEIARWIGVEPAKLKATVDEYNGACDRAYDPIFCKDSKYLFPMRVPPYYAVRGQANICDAIGGIKINHNMEVLEREDEPIPGLYAGGSTTGCWETESYCYKLTGHLLGFALNSGRIAGENAAKYILS